MQKKRAKGLFINSSYRRTGLLKTLLRGFQHCQDQEEIRDIPYDRGDGVLPPSSRYGSDEKGEGTRIKKVASL